MRGRLTLLPVCLAAVAGPVTAADLPQFAPTPEMLFAPTNPVGVASEVPRSPLTDVVANALPRFGTPEAARRHCPTDVVVWIAFGSNFYRRDRRGPVDPPALGAFMCQADASAEGDRPLHAESPIRP